jgi:hypothetical protein
MASHKWDIGEFLRNLIKEKKSLYLMKDGRGWEKTLVGTDGKIFIYEILDTGASCLKVIDGLVAPSKSQ